jgi:hypothetical protein
MPNWKKLIVSGSDANLSSLNIDGSLTASSAYLESASIGHLQTIYETASVIYSSGSTKFGDTLDDTHEITGSLLVTGSITGDLTGTASYATTASHALNVPDTASHALTAVSSSFTATGDGVFSGSFSGSFVGDASNLNVNPFPFTGSGEMQGKLTVESFQDYIDEEYVESYFAGTSIASSGDIALTGSIFSSYINADQFTGSFSGSHTGSFNGYVQGFADLFGDFNGEFSGDGTNINNIQSSSFASTASLLLGNVENAVLAQTASFIETAQTASYYNGSVISASLSETASFIEVAQTASFVETAQTASFVETAQTASYGNSFTASNLYVEGTASITYLESVYETSSIIYSSGSTKFGDDTVDTHERTGSVEISGSLTVTGPSTLVASQSVNNNTSSGSLSFWQGSQAEYDLISASADNNTIYFVV